MAALQSIGKKILLILGVITNCFLCFFACWKIFLHYDNWFHLVFLVLLAIYCILHIIFTLFVSTNICSKSHLLLLTFQLILFTCSCALLLKHFLSDNIDPRQAQLFECSWIIISLSLSVLLILQIFTYTCQRQSRLNRDTIGSQPFHRIEPSESKWHLNNKSNVSISEGIEQNNQSQYNENNVHNTTKSTAVSTPNLNQNVPIESWHSMYIKDDPSKRSFTTNRHSDFTESAQNIRQFLSRKLSRVSIHRSADQRIHKQQSNHHRLDLQQLDVDQLDRMSDLVPMSYEDEDDHWNKPSAQMTPFTIEIHHSPSLHASSLHQHELNAF